MSRAVLDEVDRRRVERMSAVPCPKCGQLNPDRIWPQPRLIALSLSIVLLAALCAGLVPKWTGVFLVGACVTVLWPYTLRWRCKACGQRWLAPDPDSVVEDEADSHEDEKDEADESP